LRLIRRLPDAFRAEVRPAEKMGVQAIVTTPPQSGRSSLNRQVY
jgi:hypothetical protein